MTVAEALAQAASQGLARLDAQLLLLHVLGRRADDRAWLITHDMELLPDAAASAFGAACLRRMKGEPVAYLVGEKEFHGLCLHVDARVLVPRPDTETLVDWALELLPCDEMVRVIDLGTGSGAIALAIANACPRAVVEAVDVSRDALEVARANAAALGVHVRFRLANWLEGATGPYQLIVSNPPYISAGDEHLEALRFEPRQALVSGSDGLDDIRAIIEQAPSCLSPGAWLLLEHGHTQAGSVRQLMEGRGFTDISSRRDLGGIERSTGGRWLELG